MDELGQNQDFDFDFDQSTAQAWQLFGERLADVVSMIEDSATLTIGTDPSDADDAPWVRFTCQPRAQREQVPVMLAEASSNASLGEDDQLDLAGLEAMDALGWNAPSAEGEHAGPNFWLEQAQDESDQLAGLAVSTLRDVFGVVHPVFLAPDHLSEVLNPDPTMLEAPEPSGVLEAHDVVATMPRDRAHLDQMVELELQHMFGHAPIRDSEGDIAIRVGSSVVFVRASEDAAEVLVFSPLVHDVEGRSRAVEVLNDLNVESRYGRFSLYKDRVFVSISLFARPFVPSHLHEGVRVMSQLADAIDDELASKLRGRTSYSEQE